MINRLSHYQQLLTRSRDSQRALVGVVQMCSTPNMDDNFKKNKKYIEECASRGAKIVCLPENFHCMTLTYAQGVNIAEKLDGDIIKRYKQIALDNQIWLSLGGFQEQAQNLLKRYNTHLLINEEGNIVQTYRKLHLFDVDLTHRIPGATPIKEDRYIEPGDEIPDPIQTPIGYVCPSISNDVRYPELYRRYVQRGAQVLLVSSAFLLKTGASHWESLLRARAIENQCYVVAANQVGVHHEKRQSYGHSMVIDPWGDIIGQMSDKEGCFVCEIDLEYLDKVRGNMACITHMRGDVIYGGQANNTINHDDGLQDTDGHHIN
eukprot:403377015